MNSCMTTNIAAVTNIKVVIIKGLSTPNTLMHICPNIKQKVKELSRASKVFTRIIHIDAHYSASVDEALLRNILVDKHYKTMYF